MHERVIQINQCSGNPEPDAIMSLALKHDLEERRTFDGQIGEGFGHITPVNPLVIQSRCIQQDGHIFGVS